MTHLRSLLLCFFLIILGPQIQCGDYYLISDIGTSAKSIGTGHIQGFNDSAHTIFENPAGLYRINEVSLSLFTTTFMGELFYNNIGVSGKTAWGTLGLGFMELGSYNNPYTGIKDTVHYVIDTFDYKSTLTKFTYQYSYSDALHLGASYNFYQTDAHVYTGSAQDIDLGFIFLLPQTTVSLFARNIIPNNTVKYNHNLFEPLQFQLIASASHRLRQLTLYYQFSMVEHHSLPSFGITYDPFSTSVFFITGGYSHTLDGYKRVSARYNLGLVLKLNEIELSYAYEKTDYYESDHNNFFSMSISY